MTILNSQSADKFGINNFRGQVGRNFADPEQPQDAATKAYVDSEISSIPPQTAANTSTDTTNFDGVLTSADDTVQKALDTLDDAFELGPTPYIHLGMSANQTVDNGTALAFDTVRASNTLTRNGYGVNLEAGKTYKLTSYVSFVSSTVGYYCGFQFYASTTAIGQGWYHIATAASSGYMLNTEGVMFYTPSVDTIVYVKVTDDQIGTGQVTPSYNTYFIVEQVVGMKGDKGDTGDVSVSDIEWEGWNTPTFENSWVNYDTNHASAKYTKDALGFVHLRGLVKGGTLGLTVPIFTLPVGYRPAMQELFVVLSNATTGRVDVWPDGKVSASSPSSNLWVQLNGITFKAEN